MAGIVNEGKVDEYVGTRWLRGGCEMHGENGGIYEVPVCQCKLHTGTQALSDEFHVELLRQRTWAPVA